MNVPVIHVHSYTDRSTLGYLTFMWDTMRALANNPDNLKMSVHCIGQDAANSCTGLTNARAYVVPGANNDQGGSMVHGVCIQHALTMVDDGDIHLNVDSDTSVLAKGWDDYVRTQLLDEKIGLIGAAFEDIGGFTSGNDRVQMFKNIPYTAWMGMSPLHRWRDLRTNPAIADPIAISTDELSKIYNLPVGYSALSDTGWQIPGYLHAHHISYVGWKQLKGGAGAVVLKGLDNYHEEYHVDNNVPFVVHQRGSRKHGYRAEGPSRNFYAAIDAYLLRECDGARRWHWQPTAANELVLARLLVQADEARMRPSEVACIATTAEQVAQQVSAVNGNPGDPTMLAGWLKATIDGTVAWSRHVQPVPKQVSLAFVPDACARNVRLEGTVGGLNIYVPAVTSKAYTVTVRNLLPETTDVMTVGTTRAVSVPAGACWLLLADVDGVVRAQ